MGGCIDSTNLSSLVVKYRPRAAIPEAKNMIYVAQNRPKIPVPEVFAYCTYGPIDREIDDYGSLYNTYIFMSLVEGETLDTVWTSYDRTTKTRVASQLKEYMDDLRSMGNASYIGSVDHGSATDRILATCKSQGPFDSEKEFIDAILEAHKRISPGQHVKKFLLGVIGAQEHHILFTHGYFRPQNIMVKDSNVTGIIEWELNGWYPEYWEFVKALAIWRWQNDWGLSVGHSSAILLPACLLLVCVASTMVRANSPSLQMINEQAEQFCPVTAKLEIFN